jgi:hypothetical protein
MGLGTWNCLEKRVSYLYHDTVTHIERRSGALDALYYFFGFSSLIKSVYHRLRIPYHIADS